MHVIRNECCMCPQDSIRTRMAGVLLGWYHCWKGEDTLFATSHFPANKSVFSLYLICNIMNEQRQIQSNFMDTEEY